MRRVNLWLALSFLIFSPLAFASSPSSISPSRPFTASTARSQEGVRREILSSHVSWEWVIAVLPPGTAARPAVPGLLMGMRNGASGGATSSVGWFTVDGKMQWLAVSVPSTTPQKWRLAENATDPPQEITDPAVIPAKLEAIFGAPATLDLVHAWVLGQPSPTAWPSDYAREESAVHPLQGTSPAGVVHWTKWEYVPGEKGRVVPLPAMWTLENARGTTQFAMQSYEARGVGSETEKGWPFAPKTASAPSLPVNAKEPIIRPEDLDYQAW